MNRHRILELLIRFGLERYIPKYPSRLSVQPVFIMGNQKSGASAIAHLLAASIGEAATVDIPEFWEPFLTHLYNDRLALKDWVCQNPAAFSNKVIKEPNLTPFWERLRHIFPGARFVFVVRDPRCNIRSILDRLQIPGDLEHWDSDEAPYLWRHLFKWDQTISEERYIEQLASRWSSFCAFYEAQEAHCELIRYEDFCDNKVGVVEELAIRLGETPTVSIDQLVDVPFQPRGKHRSVGWDRFYSEKNLAAITEACGAYMHKFNYKQ